MPLEQDVSQVSSLIQSTPEQAVDHIQNANVLQMSPDTYKEHKDAGLQDFVTSLTRPVTATATVADYMNKSTEHAAAIAPDIEHLGVAENVIAKSFRIPGTPEPSAGGFQLPRPDKELNDIARNMGSGFARGVNDPDQQRKEILWDKLNSQDGKIDIDSELTLQSLNEQSQDNYGNKDYGLTGANLVPGQFAEGLGGLIGQANRHKEMFAKIVAAQTLIGAAGGTFATPVVGTMVGAGIGFSAGLESAYLATGFWDAYKGTASSVYGDLDNMKDENGSPLNLSHQNKAALAKGTGVVLGTLQFAANKVLLNTIPALSSFSSKQSVQAAMQSPIFRSAVMRVGKTMGETGTIGVMSSYATQLVQELGKLKGDYSIENISHAIMESDRNVLKNLPVQPGQQGARDQLIHAGLINSLVGGIFHGAIETATPLIKETLQGIRDQNLPSSGVMRDVSPESAPQISAPKPNDEIVIDDVGPVAPTPSDVHDTPATLQQVDEAFTLQQALDTSKALVDQTGVKRMSPDMANDIKADMFRRSGVTRVWMDKADMGSFVDAGANDEEKKRRSDAVRAILDPEGLAALQNNQPIPLDIRKVLDIHDKFEDLSYFVKRTETGATPTTAEQLAKNMEAQAKKAIELKAKINPIANQSPEERAYKIALTPESTDEEVAAGLQTREQAIAYLGRLDVNEESVKAELRPHQTNIDFQSQKLSEAQKALSEVDSGKVIRLNDKKDLELRDAQSLVDLKTRLIEGHQNNAAPYLKQIADIQTMRERVQKLVPQLPDEASLLQTHQEALKAMTHLPSNDVFNEADFLNQDTLSKAIGDVSPDKEAEKIDQSLLNHRIDAAKNIHEAGMLDMNELHNFLTEQANDISKQEIEDKLKIDLNIQVVEKFINAVSDNGVRTYQIDPGTLTPAQQRKLLKNEQMKKSKVFRKGSKLTADQAAQLIGGVANSGEVLLNILSSTPNLKDSVELELERIKPKNVQQVKDTVDLDKTAIVKSYNAIVDDHLKTMTYLKNKEWPVTKKIIRRIGTEIAVPKRAQLEIQATKVIGNTKLRDLSYKPFIAGERKSQSIAMKALTDGDMMTAFTQKKASAFNAALTIEARKSIAKVNRATKFFKKFNSSETDAILNKAGRTFSEAANEIRDVFNLNPKQKYQSIRGGYHRFVVEMVKAGMGDMGVNPALSDVRENINEMTVAEILQVERMARMILNSAEKENELIAIREGQNFKAVGDELIASLEGHPDSDFRKLIDAQDKKAIPTGFKLINFIENNEFLAQVKNLESLLVNLDRGVVGGKFQSTFLAPLKGLGVYKDQGMMLRAHFRLEIDKFMNHIIKEFGKIEAQQKGLGDLEAKAMHNLGLSEFKNLMNTYIVVPEWLSNVHFPMGRVSKAQMLMMMCHQGNEHNRIQLVEGHEVSQDEVNSVLERHLDSKYAELAQRVMNKYEMFWPHVVQQELKTTGAVPEKVQASPWVHKGVTYPGGYFPAIKETSYDIDQLSSKQRESLNLENEFDTQDFNASKMTRANHVKERTGGGGRLSLDLKVIPMSMESVAHDLAFRLPIRDGLLLLTKHKELRDAVTKVVGKNGYKVLISTMQKTAVSQRIKDTALFDSSHTWEKILAKNQHIQSVGMLVFNTGSIMIQPISLALSAERMGKNGAIHFVKVISAMRTPTMVRAFAEHAASINPAIFEHAHHVNTAAEQTFAIMVGNNIKKGMKPVAAMRDVVINGGFLALGAVDQAMKIVVSNAAYSQFVAGDAPGWSKAELDKMTPEELDHQAKIFASGIVTQTLTSGDELDKAPIQHHQVFKNLAPFFNDTRNVINANLRLMREAKQKAKSGYKKAKSGDYAGASADGYATATKVLVLLLLSTAINWGVDKRYGFNTPDPKDAVKHPDRFAKETLTFMMISPFWTSVGDLPGIRNASFAYQQYTDWGKMHAAPTEVAARPEQNIFETMKIVHDFLEGRKLKSQQVATLMYDFSYLTNEPLPVTGLFNLGKVLSNTPHLAKEAGGLLTDADKRIQDYIKSQENNQPSIADETKGLIDSAVAEQDKPDSEKLPPELVNELKEFRSKLGK